MMGMRCAYPARHTLLLPLLVGLSLSLPCAADSAALAVSGTLERRTYNPVKGTEYINEREYVVFSVLLTADRWTISSTNMTRPRYWAILSWDGTNTYVIPQQYSPLNEGREPTNELWATVYSTPLWQLESDDPTYTSFIWLTYCFRPGYIAPDSRGRRVAPVYVSHRLNPFRYGYRWEYVPSPDGRFVDLLKIIRDRSLDLPETEELLRPDFDPPQTLQAYKDFKEYLEIRRTIPDGYVEEEFVCHERFVTNGWHLPLGAEAIGYMFSWPGKMCRRVTLKTTNLIVCVGDLAAPPSPTLPTRVLDYRYRRFENDRLFLRATYMLQPGEPWRGPNDPELLAQAEEYIRNGPRYDAFLRPQMRHYLTWLAYAALVIVPLAAYALRRRLPRGTPPRT